MPKNVSSVVGNVLDETIDDVAEDVDYFGNSYKLLNNTDVVDEVAGKFGVPEEERAQLKLDLEEQTRDEIQCRSVTINNFSFSYYSQQNFVSRMCSNSIGFDLQVGARHFDREMPRDAVLAIEKKEKHVS